MPNIVKKLIFSSLVLLFLPFAAFKVYAIEDPFAYPNNPVGIHILSENDLKAAAELVNTNGDWGYITLVIRSDERDVTRWQKVFDEARRLHLIPIVRIASKQADGGWEKLPIDEIDAWVSFLNSLNWVIKNRYVVVGNEPNHETEWGGETNPEEYAEYLTTFAKKLKNASIDFFVLPAGFDASAPNNSAHMSESIFLKRMLIAKPDLFENIDGWTSHSYPNPNFSGSEFASGRGTVKTFQWELEMLRTLGITKKLPVFITETGWAHNGDDPSSGYFSSKVIGDKLKNAYETVWNDSRIVAVTPFLLDYQDDPFKAFSWKKQDGSFYEFFYKIKDMTKNVGHPSQVFSYEIVTFVLPPILKNTSTQKAYGLMYLKNTGQTIWTADDYLTLELEGNLVEATPVSYQDKIEPGQITLAIYEVDK